MKSIFKMALAAAVVVVSLCQSAYAFDLKSLVNKETISNVVGSVTGADKPELSDLVGSWKYYGPAVKFKSDNVLKNAGGEVAASTAEQKLATYYSKLKVTNVKLTVNSDNSFSMAIGKIVLKGTISKKSDYEFVFQLKASTIKLTSLNAYIYKSGSNIELLFDAKKLVSLVTKVSSVANNSTLNSMTTLVNSYDGIMVGYKLKK